MKHYLTEVDVTAYISASQIARLRTEAWVGKSIFCPSCGCDIAATPNNSKACDFICQDCKEEFELKSKSGKIGNKIINGAYSTLIKRLASHNNPNLCALNYNKNSLEVENFFIVPRYFFTKSIIEERKPLSMSARRAGWIGCNIAVHKIPEAGKIYYIKNSISLKKETVLQAWNATKFLRIDKTDESKGWLLDTMYYIDKIGLNDFTIDQLYEFEPYFKLKYPSNSHIKEKLRQKLQVLRDNGYLEFVSRGKYKIIGRH